MCPLGICHFCRLVSRLRGFQKGGVAHKHPTRAGTLTLSSGLRLRKRQIRPAGDNLLAHYILPETESPWEEARLWALEPLSLHSDTHLMRKAPGCEARF